jgi:MinD superfamily P-loop ATPase
MIPKIDVKKCDACEDCIEACPPEVISIVDGKAKIAEDMCDECSMCVEECPNGAISLTRE